MWRREYESTHPCFPSVCSDDDVSEYTIGNQKGTEGSKSSIDGAYAMRDIKAGEELVTAYDEFDTENYKAFGL